MGSQLDTDAQGSQRAGVAFGVQTHGWCRDFVTLPFVRSTAGGRHTSQRFIRN